MKDIDSYLWKCTLEALEKGVKKSDIQKVCKLEMGFVHKEKSKKPKNKQEKI